MELYIRLAIISWFAQLMQAKACSEEQGVCCSGFRLNETTSLCDKCPVGHSGMNCIYKCIYPSYGEDCAKECQCPQEQCDYVFGCSPATSAVTYRQNTENASVGESHETSTPRSGTLKAPIVFYTTITLISVFLISVLFYGVSSLCKYISSKKEAKSSKSNLNFDETGNSLYDCVEIPRYI